MKRSILAVLLTVCIVLSFSSCSDSVSSAPIYSEIPKIISDFMRTHAKARRYDATAAGRKRRRQKRNVRPQRGKNKVPPQKNKVRP